MITLTRLALFAAPFISTFTVTFTATFGHAVHATNDALDIHAFERVAPGLSAGELDEFRAGRRLFRENWVPAPAAGDFDGLGPLLNARSCDECHVRGGRGATADSGGLGLVMRIGLRADPEPDRPHPIYGRQIQDRRVAGFVREGMIEGAYDVRTVTLADGSTHELRRRRYRVADLSYGSLGDRVTLGARLAPALVGLGYLEAIPAATIHALADPDDANDDGISGRVAVLPARRSNATPRIGRFGWKATHASIEEQAAEAFHEDLGITSHHHADENLTKPQRNNLLVTSGGSPELSKDELRRVTHYVRSLAVPARRNVDDPDVVLGETLFTSIGCAACHVPTLRTDETATLGALRSKTIQPYTDLLLHDLGPGLADEKRDGAAAPNEWRTPPLWGLGHHRFVNGNTRLLHDGRARTVAEAILWHGGEATRATTAFRALSSAERTALLAFLDSL